MEDKKDNNLLNYVKNYHVPKKEPKYEDRHVVIPIPNKKLNKNKNENKETKETKESKENKKKHSKLKRVSDYKNNNINKKEDKKEPKKFDKKNKEKNLDESIKNLEDNNKFLQNQINRRENNIVKYKKKYEDQLNIIKSLELILSEQKKQTKNNNNTSKTDINNKHINDIDLINDLLAKEIEINENENLDNSFDENFEEDFAIKAVDQQIMDELYPNPDAMSYEQLLQLEDNMGNVNKGLNKNQIDKLPDVKYDKNKYSENYQCIICMEEFENNENVKLLPCDHIFHKNCIKQWLLKQKTCPFCKAEIG